MASTTKTVTRAVLLPGNGVPEDEPLDEVMWYGSLAEQLRSQLGLSVTLHNMPDPMYARENVKLLLLWMWLRCLVVSSLECSPRFHGGAGAAQVERCQQP